MIPDSGPLSAAQRSKVFEVLRAYMAEHDISQTELGAGLGESASAISALFTGSERMPEHKRDQLLRDANNWIEEDAKQRALVRPDNFHLTRIATRFFTIAKEVRASRMMGLCYGPAGVGKTFCAEAFCAEVPGTVYVRGKRSTRSGAGLLSAIFASSRRKNRARFRPRYDDLIATLENSGRLLIVDQYHRLQRGADELLWDLHDDCKLPILLVGTILDLNRLRSEEDPFGGQLSSRIQIRRDLFPEVDEYMKRGGGDGVRQGAAPVFDVETIRAIYQRGKLKLHIDAVQRLVEIANFHLGKGHLRRTDAIMFWAERVALKKRATLITLEHLQQAIGIVDDERRRGAVRTAQPAPEAATA